MRNVRSTMLVVAATAAMLGSATVPAHATYGVDVAFRVGPGDGTSVWPSVAVTPRLDGDPNTLLGTLTGIVGDGEVEPGTCELALRPSSDGTSGSARLGNCATTSFSLDFTYAVDPATGRLTGYVSGETGLAAGPKKRLDCWIEWPPFSIGCKFTSTTA